MRAPSAVNCLESLARRQVLIEKGIYPPDFPIPAHLKNGVPQHLDRVPVPDAVPMLGDHAHWISVDSLLKSRKPAVDVTAVAA